MPVEPKSTDPAGCRADGVRDRLDADRARVVAMPQVVVQLVAEEPADQHRDHEQPQRGREANEGGERASVTTPAMTSTRNAGMAGIM